MAKRKPASVFIDGFVIPPPLKNLQSYRRMALSAGKIWMEHGALEYHECVGADLDVEGVKWPFRKTVNAKKGETVVFSYIVYKSRRHRDTVNKKVLSDPRILKWMEKNAMPFDIERMAHGGFKTLVHL